MSPPVRQINAQQLLRPEPDALRTVSLFITLKFTFIDYDESKQEQAYVCLISQSGYWIKHCNAVHLASRLVGVL